MTLAQLIDEGLVATDVSLGPLTTYRSGGPAAFYADVPDVDTLTAFVGLVGDLDLLILGRGSNLVVADSGFDGLVLKLVGEFTDISVDEIRVKAGSGASLARVARTAVEAGLTGLEFFVGVPGSVGGAVRQNAGCFGSETRDYLLSARVMDLIDGSIEFRDPDLLELSYRHSNIKTSDVVIDAEFQCMSGNPVAGKEEMRRITRWRRDHQPGGTLNAGSVFKNPENISAGELIDSLGLKGTKVGDVSVSSKHANFFVAGPDATSADIRELVDVVKDRVVELSGTILEPEIQFVGFEE